MQQQQMLGIFLIQTGIQIIVKMFLLTIYRRDKSSLDMFDFKISNDDLFELPAGSVGILIGMERRKESYTDDRDPYLDGTVKNQDCCGVIVKQDLIHLHLV